MKTEVIIKVTIKHSTEKCKHVALNTFCKGLKEGLKINGINGIDDEYNLEVNKIIERKIK